ncbi:MAG: iron-containing alcohol dehydrogenase family protein [Thermoplasmatota archaeon]
MQTPFISGTPIVFGWGSIDELADHLPGGKCFLALGRSSADDLGLVEKIREITSGNLEIFRGIEPNPLDSTVEKGAVSLARSEADFILAVGGGSVIDAAKVMGVIASQGGRSIDYLTGGKVPSGLGYPFIAVPTTPGTSSEITPFAVVSVPSLGNKIGLRHPSMYPSLALIDPDLTVTLPKDQTASTGFDILAHAFESYWARSATPVTKSFTLRAVELLSDHLRGAFQDGNIREHREAISLASVMAGLSFSNTGTTICHAISYPITMDSGLPHGMACALSLPETFRILAEREVAGMEELARAFGSTPSDLPDDLRQLMLDLGAPTRLSEAGFRGGLKRIVGTDLSVLQRNLPAALDDEDISRIVRSME